MITPNTHVARGGLSNPETRSASRAEVGADFREEVSRERVRERASQRALVAEASRTNAPDREQRGRDEQDPLSRAEESSTDVAADAHEEGARGDPARQRSDAREARPAAASPTTAAKPREESAQGSTSARAATSEPQSMPSALPALTLPSAAPTVQLPAPGSIGAAASMDAPHEAEGSPALASPRTTGFTAAPLAGAIDTPLGAQPHGAALPDGVELPREIRAAQAPEGGSNAIAITARGPAPIADAASAAPTAPARLTPAEIPQFLKDLQVHVDGTAGSAFVELEPIALGRLTVELSLQPEGGVRADVRAERADGYAAVEARLPELRASLLERGFASADVQISLGLAQRDTRRDGGDMQSRRARRDGSLNMDTERVLALAPNRTGSIDLWA